MSDHQPEPWSKGAGNQPSVQDANGMMVIPWGEVDKRNIPRIVASVNACAKFDIEELLRVGEGRAELGIGSTIKSVIERTKTETITE